MEEGMEEGRMRTFQKTVFRKTKISIFIFFQIFFGRGRRDEGERNG